MSTQLRHIVFGVVTLLGCGSPLYAKTEQIMSFNHIVELIHTGQLSDAESQLASVDLTDQQRFGLELVLYQQAIRHVNEAQQARLQQRLHSTIADMTEEDAAHALLLVSYREMLGGALNSGFHTLRLARINHFSSPESIVLHAFVQHVGHWLAYFITQFAFDVRYCEQPKLAAQHSLQTLSHLQTLTLIQSVRELRSAQQRAGAFLDLAHMSQALAPCQVVGALFLQLAENDTMQQPAGLADPTKDTAEPSRFFTHTQRQSLSNWPNWTP